MEIQDVFDPTDEMDAYLIDSNPDDFPEDVRRVARRTLDDLQEDAESFSRELDFMGFPG